MEPEGHPGDGPYLGVHRFDQAVGQAVVEGRVDAFQVSADLLAEFDEFGDAAAGGPGQPAAQGVLAFFAFELEWQPQAFFEQVLVPRYYIPLTRKGRIAVKLGLHHGVVGRIPKPVLNHLLKMRGLWYKWRFGAVARTAT